MAIGSWPQTAGLGNTAPSGVSFGNSLGPAESQKPGAERLTSFSALGFFAPFVFSTGMTDATAPAPKTPWHLWVVGVISLLWNTMGVVDFTLTQLHNEAYLKQCTEEQKAYFFGLPPWLVILWGIATWGSFIGSGALLARRKLAVKLFLVSTICMVLTHAYNYGIADGLKVMGQNATGVLIFSGVIFVICVLEVIYSRAMTRRGVLR